MRAVVQRAKRAEVRVDNRVVGKIERGLLVLLGVGQEDDRRDLEYLADKIANLRIFEDSEEKMNLSVLETGGSILQDQSRPKSFMTNLLNILRKSIILRLKQASFRSRWMWS